MPEARDVGRDERVGLLPQWMICGKWLWGSHVERGASQVTRSKGLYQRIAHHKVASASVGEDGPWLHASEEVRVHQATSLRCAGQERHHDVRLRHKVGQVVHGMNLGKGFGTFRRKTRKRALDANDT